MTFKVGKLYTCPHGTVKIEWDPPNEGEAVFDLFTQKNEVFLFLEHHYNHAFDMTHLLFLDKRARRVTFLPRTLEHFTEIKG